MGDISIKGRSKLLGGGRVGFKSGGRVGLKAGGRTKKQFGGPLARPGVMPARPLARPGVMPARPLGLKAGGGTVSETAATENIISRASKKMKEEVAEVAKKKKDKLAEAAKKKRDKLQAQHITPKGRLADRPGPHKRSSNRTATEELLGFLPKKAKEGIIKFADKFDEKQSKKWKARDSKMKEAERQKDILTN